MVGKNNHALTAVSFCYVVSHFAETLVLTISRSKHNMMIKEQLLYYHYDDL